MPKEVLLEKFRNWKINGRKFRKKAGMLPFDEAEGVVSYSTLGGPSFHHPDVVVYENNCHNVATSLNRLDVSRPNEKALRLCNTKVGPGGNRDLSRYLDSYYRKIRGTLKPQVAQLRCEMDEQVLAALDKEHAKYELRKRCITKLLEQEDMIRGLFMERVTIKIKIPEAAKFGKGSRAVGDYSCPGSLIAPFLVGPLKEAFSQRTEHDGCVIRYVGSTDPAQIDSIVTEMYNSDMNYFIYFSDDMMCKIHRNGKPEYYNLDISSCDKSNTRSVFNRLSWFYAGSDWQVLMDRAIAQCSSSILIRNPHREDQWITANTCEPTEFSGTILTTVLNNIAASAICLSINYHLKRPSALPTSDLISKAAFAVGYLVTGEACEGPENLQFLKMSFWEDDTGALHSFLNLGAILRSFGSCWMDYPFNRRKKESLHGAIRFRNWSVLQGYKHCGDTCVTRALKASPGTQKPSTGKYVNITKLTAVDFQYKQWYSLVARVSVPDSALHRRYGIDPLELEELCRLISVSDVGSIIHCAAVYRILAVDYGYGLHTTMKC